MTAKKPEAEIHPNGVGKIWSVELEIQHDKATEAGMAALLEHGRWLQWLAMWRTIGRIHNGGSECERRGNWRSAHNRIFGRCVEQQCTGRFCQRKNQATAEKHSCPFNEDVNNANEPAYCDCCDDCWHGCAMEI